MKENAFATVQRYGHSSFFIFDIRDPFSLLPRLVINNAMSVTARDDPQATIQIIRLVHC